LIPEPKRKKRSESGYSQSASLLALPKVILSVIAAFMLYIRFFTQPLSQMAQAAEKFCLTVHLYIKTGSLLYDLAVTAPLRDLTSRCGMPW